MAQVSRLLNALSAAELASLCQDCGIPAEALPSTKEGMIARILSWRSKKGLREAEEVRRPTIESLPTPSRTGRRGKSCELCKLDGLNGSCACPLLQSDPLRPVEKVLAWHVLGGQEPQTRPGSCRGRNQVRIKISCNKAEGCDEGVLELRCSDFRRPVGHSWPHHAAVHLNGSQIWQAETPNEGVRRNDIPLEVRLPPDAPDTSCLDFFSSPAGGALGSFASRFVLCLVQVRRKRVEDLVKECLARPKEPAHRTCELQQQLHKAWSSEAVECCSPLEQPLICPLTRARLIIPARGEKCRHASCFELEAYLRTTAAMPYHRRWCCPICDKQLLPAEIVVCELTLEMLQAHAAKDFAPFSLREAQPAQRGPRNEGAVEENVAPTEKRLLSSWAATNKSGRKISPPRRCWGKRLKGSSETPVHLSLMD